MSNHSLRKVSGGGGWGAKRGLLSLDPETTYSQRGRDDNGDVERFERLLAQRMQGQLHEDEGGVVAPGSFVQFFVAAEPDGPRERAESRDQRWMFGTTPWGYSSTDSGAEEQGGTGGGVVFREGSFGALTSHGLFLRSAMTNGGEVLSKVDAPYSAVTG